jgi:hypothetical protein
MAIGQQGKAFVTIEADLKPFAKTLGREIPVLLKIAQAQVKEAFGDAGDKGGKNFSKKLGDQVKKKGAFLSLTSSLAAALDDGISALPAEVKAALVIGIIAAIPVAAALLTGAISAALIAGFGAIGVLIAAQYDIVRLEGTELFNDLRNILVGAGAAFVQPVLDAIRLLHEGTQALSGPLADLFGVAAKFIVPLTQALLAFAEGAIPGLQESLENLVDLLPTLIEGAQFLGEAFGEALAIITGSDEAETSLRSLIGVIGVAVLATAHLIRAFTELFGLLVDVAPFFFPFLFALDEGDKATIQLADSTVIYTKAQLEAIAATNKQEIAMRKQEAATKAAQKAVDDFIDSQYEAVHSQIDFERALDDVTEAVKENGRSLDITGPKGRKVAEAVLKGLEAARKAREDNIASGKMTEAQAEAHYQAELTRLRNTAIKAGVAKKAYDDLAASVGAVGANPVNIVLSKQAQAVIQRIKDAVNAVLSLGNYRPPSPTSNPRNRPPEERAMGGIITSPTLALVGEAGAEAIVPLTRPQRAAQVMAEAGLGGMGDVYVYVGDEQLTNRMYRVARGAQRQQAVRLYAGTRTGF